jgi:HSP20 family protein
MPMRYRRLTAQFVHRSSLGPVASHGDPFWGTTLLTVAPRVWRPAIDICETGAGLLVQVELAGLDEDRTDVDLYADALVVEGERLLDDCGPDARYHRAEIRQGRFRVEMALPFPVDAEAVDATYDRGLLRITLPRARRDER